MPKVGAHIADEWYEVGDKIRAPGETNMAMGQGRRYKHAISIPQLVARETQSQLLEARKQGSSEWSMASSEDVKVANVIIPPVVFEDDRANSSRVVFDTTPIFDPDRTHTHVLDFSYQ